MAFARGDPRNAHGPSNAKLFVRLYRDRFRHVEGLGWYSWDGYRWKRTGAKMALWEAGEMAEEIPDIAPARPVQRPGTPSTGAGCSSSCPTTANRTGRRLPARCQGAPGEAVDLPDHRAQLCRRRGWGAASRHSPGSMKGVHGTGAWWRLITAHRVHS
ncbi:hypothetical protein [Streptomyces anulatus]|uniref:hypothetical protein n=1 Tax=Streptomyces anulatus TaxID=1892 RepID=UPI00386A830B